MTINEYKKRMDFHKRDFERQLNLFGLIWGGVLIGSIIALGFSFYQFWK